MRCLLAILWVAGLAPAQTTPAFLQPCRDVPWADGALQGTYRVVEDRAAGRGRRIGLHVVVLRATGPDRRPDPVVVLAGGPGQAATSLAPGLARSWMRRNRDIVLIDQRGTGRSNPLRVELPGSDQDLQGYLLPIFEPATFRRALPRLQRRADLTLYTTPIAADDLDEVRRALGYRQVNLVGGSYGTRAALVYIRRHPQAVRTAILTGVAPIAFKNPLYHARAAQQGFDTLLAECRADPRYAAYHDLDRQLATILDRLERAPAKVTVAHPAHGRPTQVTLTRDRFCEGLRVLMYYLRGNRSVPRLVHRAFGGDYRPFAESAIRSNRGLRNSLAFGMLMSVVGSEDIPRITDEEIATATAGTFLGDRRVRSQRAVAALWPRGEVPANYGQPVAGDMPVLFLSGSHDPVTPPRWGAEAARHFPNGLHLVVPAAHGTSDPRIERLKREFLDAGSTHGLDTGFVAGLRMPPLELPNRRVIR